MLDPCSWNSLFDIFTENTSNWILFLYNGRKINKYGKDKNNVKEYLFVTEFQLSFPSHTTFTFI